MEADKENKAIIGYKGFDKDFKCRDFQYEVGKEYTHEGKVEICSSGFHFCENPHDVFRYYNAGENNRFAVVEADEVADEKSIDDSKRVARKLKIKAEISVFELCKIAVVVFFKNFGFDKKIKSAKTNNAGKCGAANAGDCGAANAGYKGAANAGDCGAANAGYKGAANAGNCGAANAGPMQVTVVQPMQVTVVQPMQGTVVQPMQVTVVQPMQVTVVQPMQGTVVQPMQGTKVQPMQGTVVQP